jgi:hypothetical protein
MEVNPKKSWSVIPMNRRHPKADETAERKKKDCLADPLAVWLSLNAWKA